MLVASNVIIDVRTPDAIWHEWSSAAVADAAGCDDIAINQIIYEAIDAGFPKLEELDVHPSVALFRGLNLPCEAGLVAVRAFVVPQRSRFKGQRCCRGRRCLR